MGRKEEKQERKEGWEGEEWAKGSGRRRTRRSARRQIALVVIIIVIITGTITGIIILSIIAITISITIVIIASAAFPPQGPAAAAIRQQTGAWRHGAKAGNEWTATR